MNMAASADSTSPSWTDRLDDGSEVLIRPLQGDDAAIELELLQRCSPQARRHRFLASVQPTAELARQLTTLDPQRDVAFVAVLRESGAEHAVGISRCRVADRSAAAEC